LKGQIQKAT